MDGHENEVMMKKKWIVNGYINGDMKMQ